MAKKFIKLWDSYSEYFEPLSDAEVGRLVRAMINYSKDGTLPQLSGNERFVWGPIRREMDEDAEKMESFISKQAENGKKGGAPVGNSNARKQPKTTQNSPNQPKTIQTTQDKGERIKDKGQRIKDIGERSEISYQLIVDSYNDTCVSLPRLQNISDRRKQAIRRRLNKYSVEQVQEAFRKAEASDFLKGDNNRDWRADFDWIMNDTNIAKILDGKYDNRGDTVTDRDDFLYRAMSHIPVFEEERE